HLYFLGAAPIFLTFLCCRVFSLQINIWNGDWVGLLWLLIFTTMLPSSIPFFVSLVEVFLAFNMGSKFILQGPWLDQDVMDAPFTCLGDPDT
ncbi:hypothetical protein ACJX0J_023748, partial [Zea mays]